MMFQTQNIVSICVRGGVGGGLTNVVVFPIVDLPLLNLHQSNQTRQDKSQNLYLSCILLGIAKTRKNALQVSKFYTRPAPKITCPGDRTSGIFKP